MKRFALAGALLALAVPAAAEAKNTTAKQNARAACKELRSTSKAAFKAEHGNRKGKKAWRGCMSEWVQEAREARSNAAKECKAERDDAAFADSHDGKTFTEFYGTNRSGKNAYGKCVSSKAKAQVEEQVEAETEAIENAARQCRAERTEMGREAFREEYGSNRNKRNAFGKCVSQKAAEQEEEEQA